MRAPVLTCACVSFYVEPVLCYSSVRTRMVPYEAASIQLQAGSLEPVLHTVGPGHSFLPNLCCHTVAKSDHTFLLLRLYPPWFFQKPHTTLLHLPTSLSCHRGSPPKPSFSEFPPSQLDTSAPSLTTRLPHSHWTTQALRTRSAREPTPKHPEQTEFLGHAG